VRGPGIHSHLAVFEILRKKFCEVLFRMLSDAYLLVNLDKQVPLRAELVSVRCIKFFQLVLHGLEFLCRILSAVLDSENLKHLRAEAIDWRLVVRLAVDSGSEWTRWPPYT
jgi:hypothetical protein